MLASLAKLYNETFCLDFDTLCVTCHLLLPRSFADLNEELVLSLHEKCAASQYLEEWFGPGGKLRASALFSAKVSRIFQAALSS